MIPTNERTTSQTRIRELCEEVVRLRMELKPQLMAQAFRRWDSNPATKDRAGAMTQDYSQQYDADIKDEVPELYGEDQ